MSELKPGDGMRCCSFCGRDTRSASGICPRCGGGPWPMREARIGRKELEAEIASRASLLHTNEGEKAFREELDCDRCGAPVVVDSRASRRNSAPFVCHRCR